MKAINNILSSFEPISLNQMDEVKLMNRTDTKFVFEYSLLEKVIEEIKAHYYVLDIDGVRLNAYRSLYFDTKDFKFYFEHHNGKKNRNKVNEHFNVSVYVFLLYFSAYVKQYKDLLLPGKLNGKFTGKI